MARVQLTFFSWRNGWHACSIGYTARHLQQGTFPGFHRAQPHCLCSVLSLTDRGKEARTWGCTAAWRCGVQVHPSISRSRIDGSMDRVASSRPRVGGININVSHGHLASFPHDLVRNLYACLPVPGIDRVGGSESAPATTTRKNDGPIAYCMCSLLSSSSTVVPAVPLLSVNMSSVILLVYAKDMRRAKGGMCLHSYTTYLKATRALACLPV